MAFSPRVRMHRETFARPGVDHVVRVLAELPGPGVAALRTPADVDVVRPVPGHAPLPAAELALRVESEHLSPAEAVTSADPHAGLGKALSDPGVQCFGRYVPRCARMAAKAA